MLGPLSRNSWIILAGLSGMIVGFVGGYAFPRNAPVDSPIPESSPDRGPELSTPSSSGPAELAGKTALTSSSSKPQTPSAGRIEAAAQIYKSLPPAGDSREFGGSERQEWVQNLSPEEIPLFLEGFCAAHSGPQGMSFEEKWLVNRALKNWWKADRQSVLNWVSGLPPGPTKRFLSSELLESIVLESDPALATRMAKDFKARDPEWDMDGFQEKIAIEAIEQAWKNPVTTAEQMLDLYSQLPAKKNSTTGSPVRDYPENFDFRKFLDGLTALSKQNKEPRRLPSDALTAWAKADPQSATAWFIENSGKSQDRLPFMEWSNIAEAVSSTHGTQSYYEWASAVLSSASDQFLNTKFHPSGSELLGIAQATQNPAARDRILSRGIGGADIESTIRYLGMMSSPESRLRAISQNRYHFQMAAEKFQLDESLFQGLGLTSEQVNEIIKPGGPPRIIRRNY